MYHHGIYDRLTNNTPSIRYKTELLQFIIALGKINFSLNPEKWEINLEPEVGETLNICIGDTSIFLTGFQEGAMHRFKGIEANYSIHTKLDSARRAAARAAVFARNFSHITGSHVISNPEFRHSLAGEDLMREFRNRLGESHRDFVGAENDLFRFMLEKTNSVEKLWTQGTKVLAEARDKMGTGERLMENTRRFHEYLQGRFDFIARAIDSTEDQPEPVWLVKDLMEGFLNQTAYLDTLVADVGLRRTDMEFRVSLVEEGNRKHEFIAEWKPSGKTSSGILGVNVTTLPLEVSWRPASGTTGQIEDHAMMVALPGGMVSAHALYSLLENIIRNSAKYGSLKEKRQKAKERYRLTLELRRADGHFDLRIWDNYSGAVKPGVKVDDQQPWKYLQGNLEQDFVKPSGEQATSNLGMMEMQACAQMLCRKVDKKYPGGRPDHVCAYLNGEARKEKAREFNLWTADINGSEKEQGELALTYQLTLNVPVLLAGLTMQQGKGMLSFRTNSLKEVQKNWPHLLVLDGAKGSNAEAWLDEIAKAPDAFPYRTFVLCPEDTKECQKQWEQKWEQKIKGKDISPHRVRAVRNIGGSYGKVFVEQDYDTNEHVAILAAYESWLRAWKGEPTTGKWHLWIGMGRPAGQVKEAWAAAVEEFNPNSGLVRLGVRAFENGCITNLFGGVTAESVFSISPEAWNAVLERFPKEAQSKPDSLSEEQKYWLAERAADPKNKRALVFDNHGNCFPGAYDVEKETDLRRSTRFYQKLSGTVSPDLFRTLNRPPTDTFGFHFFIYSLVEACLTNIVVVDERLAWNLVEGGNGGEKNKDFAQNLADHQKAGTFPVFRFRQTRAGKDVGYYNARHQDLVRNCVKDSRGDATMKDEGVTFGTGANPGSALKLVTPEALQDKQGFRYIEAHMDGTHQTDVLLIHEGAMDILTSEQGVTWIKEVKDDGTIITCLPELYKLAPAIVRTSGRGRKSKLLGEHLPFVEFGEVSSALLTARNKFSLVRGLLGSAGGEAKPASPDHAPIPLP